MRQTFEILLDIPDVTIEKVGTEGRAFQLGEGGHSSKNAVRFWNSSSRIPKETHSLCYASVTAYVRMIPPCNSCS